MKLQQLRYFQAACQHGSITAAAQSLHVSQPSISMAIRELEGEFGVLLTVRRYQGFTLTEAGDALLKMSNGLLNHADRVERRMKEMSRKHHPVRLGVPPMIGTSILPSLYTDFLPEHSGIALVTEESGTKTLLRNVLENTLDLAFVTHSDPLSTEFASLPIARTETVWCVSPLHPLAKAGSIAIEQLKAEPLVLFESSFSQYELITRRFESAGITPQVLHYTGQLSTVHSLIRSGVASGFLLRPIAEKLPDVIGISLDPPVTAQISLVWERRRRLSPDMLELIDRFRHFRALAGQE